MVKGWQSAEVADLFFLYLPKTAGPKSLYRPTARESCGAELKNPRRLPAERFACLRAQAVCRAKPQTLLGSRGEFDGALRAALPLGGNVLLRKRASGRLLFSAVRLGCRAAAENSAIQISFFIAAQ